MSRAYHTPELPYRAVAVDPPVLMKVSSWVPLKVDAHYTYAGITWARVVGGFGGRGDREDWIAVLPGVSISISRYHNEPWRAKYSHAAHGDRHRSTMQAAMHAAMVSARGYAKHRRCEAQDQVDGYSTQIRLLTKALS